jgi:hypothetical protein
MGIGFDKTLNWEDLEENNEQKVESVEVENENVEEKIENKNNLE